MAKYRKKPVVVDAWYWQGTTLEQATSFLKARGLPNWGMGHRNGITGIVIPTLEGDMVVEKGSWIIRGVKGEFYPCKPDIFQQTYEKVE
jgi:hypothetical protein